ncbi:MAG: metalloregulator ArsR/SmtB family transcription factor [Candidatus Methylopumilus sp.]|jgi:ArsR family transcriptional regulator
MSENINPKEMQKSANKACKLMKVLSNRDRLLLLCQINLGEKSVTELEEILDIHQPTLSQQLSVLRSGGLVQTRRDGKKIYYSLSSDIAAAVMSLLYQHFCVQ